MYLAEGPVLMLIENGTVRNGGLGGLYTPPAPLRESFPRALVRYFPPRAGVVRGTLLLASYVMYAVVDAWGSSAPPNALWECLAAL
jgi:hypothetical protein